MTYKAHEIGIQLGIPYNKLMKFKQDGNLFLTALDYWLNENIPNTPVSWVSLVSALESEQVGERKLAEDIRRKYCTQLVELSHDSSKSMATNGLSLQGALTGNYSLLFS